MSWADLVIAVAVLVATERGYALGVLRQVGSVVGLIVGFLAGVWVAPLLAVHFHQNLARPIVAAWVVVVFLLLGSVAGRRLGGVANTTVRRLKLGPLDRTLGALFAALGALVVCWLVASLLVNVSVASINSEIANSKLLAVMDDVMPPVPSLEAQVQGFFRRSNFPSVFASVVQPLTTPVALPTTAVAKAQVGDDSKSVVKVLAFGACGVDKEGTGFVVGPNEVVTAAHVVAGARTVAVGNGAARLIAFDPDNDVAVLHVSTTGLTVINLQAPAPPRGTAAAVLGYPEDGGLTLTRAAIAGNLTAQGRSIYNGPLFTRHLVVLDGDVEPGNSGSPLFVGGRAVGLVFSKSVVQDDVGYAVPAAVVKTDLAGASATADLSTGRCLPAE